MQTVITTEEHQLNTIYTPYSARMSPENSLKIMGFYTEVEILGVIL